MTSQVTGRVRSTSRWGVHLDDGNSYPWGLSVSDPERSMASGQVTLLVSDDGIAQGILPGWPSTASSTTPEPEALETVDEIEGHVLRSDALNAALKWHLGRTGPEPSHSDIVSTARYFEWYLRGGK